jgi:CHAT domain-containing protein/Tfp pilus assembly protein PilF
MQASFSIPQFRAREVGCLCAIAALGLLICPLPAQQPAGPSEMTAAERQELLVRRHSRMQEAGRLRQEGTLPEAIAAGEQVLELERRLFGAVHPTVANTLVWLAQTQAARDDFAQATALCRQAVDVAGQFYGEDHWRAADARRSLAHVERLAQLEPPERKQLEVAEKQIQTAAELAGQGKTDEAVRLVGRSAEVRRQLLGEESPVYLDTLETLAAIHQSVFDFAEAERLGQRVIEIRAKSFGREHPGYLAGLNRLGLLYYSMGDYHQAGPVLQQALETAQGIFGPGHPDTVTCLNNLAGLYHAQGDYAQAEPLLREALGVCRALRGPEHPDYATALSSLAGLYQSMGDYARAEPLLDQALAIRRSAFGREHPDYAVSLNNLAGLYYQTGDYARAEPLFRETIEIRKEILGPTHPDYATSLNNLAALYEATGEQSKAEPLYREALEIRKESLGPTHPDYAAGLNNLAALLRSLGEYDQAEPLYQEALQIRSRTLGSEHPDYAASLNNLGVLYRSKGDFARAEPLYRQALEIQHRVLSDTFAVLSQRQQLAMTRSLRRTLDGYLSVTAVTDGRAERSYQYVLAWKGMVFVRQRQTRLAAARPELAPVVAELQSTASRLAALVFSRPAPQQRQAWQRQLAELSEKKEQLEAELARRGAELAPDQGGVTAERLQASLPADAALVDFLEYTHSPPRPEGAGDEARPAQHLAAFIVRAGRPVVRLSLGPTAPIHQAIDVWRRTYGRPGKGELAAIELRKALWLPLQAHLADAPTVLVSPDGNLARFPLAALPGKEQGTYLLEERAVAVVAVPQSLPELFSETDTTPSPDAEPDEPSLLLLGDIDYDAAPEPSQEPEKTGADLPAQRHEGLQFARLDSSRGEILAVRDSFELAFDEGEVRMLRRSKATEAAFRQEAPVHRFLHVATHGFFAPPEWTSLFAPAESDRSGTPPRQAPRPGSKLAALHPGLLSGLALAGANAPPRAGLDDGILTAEEVASLDLAKVDLAVLSACETGLGPVAGGEGVLGLQRAFQVSGARSVVASLWKVSDEETRRLMEGFYENLWDKKTSKLEALRQAQLAMLREGPQRGMAIVSKTKPTEKPRRSPPYYWAAFVLSGDWR